MSKYEEEARLVDEVLEDFEEIDELQGRNEEIDDEIAELVKQREQMAEELARLTAELQTVQGSNADYGLEPCSEEVHDLVRDRGVFSCTQCPETRIGSDVFHIDAFVVRFDVNDERRVVRDSLEVLEGVEEPKKVQARLSWLVVNERFPPASAGESYSVTCGWEPSR